VITIAEQWMFVARVAHSLPVQELRQKKNLAMQIPPERHALLRRSGFEGELGGGADPTHVMTATFLSADRAAAVGQAENLTNRRSDFYYLEYSITDVNSREIVWSDRFEFQREAVGLVID
jgi:hypothetical protein